MRGSARAVYRWRKAGIRIAVFQQDMIQMSVSMSLFVKWKKRGCREEKRTRSINILFPHPTSPYMYSDLGTSSGIVGIGGGIRLELSSLFLENNPFKAAKKVGVLSSRSANIFG